MNIATLETLEDADLRAIIARADELLKRHDEDRKAKALNEARTLLASVGLSLKDLNGKTGHKASKGPVYKGGHVYQHPSNKALIWNAKGKKPNWLLAIETDGGKPLDLQAANDNAGPTKTTNDAVTIRRAH